MSQRARAESLRVPGHVEENARAQRDPGLRPNSPVGVPDRPAATQSSGGSPHGLARHILAGDVTASGTVAGSTREAGGRGIHPGRARRPARQARPVTKTPTRP